MSFYWYIPLISEQNMKFCENIIIFIFYSVIFIGLSFGDVQGKKWHNHTINVQTFLVEIWNNDNNNNKKKKLKKLTNTIKVKVVGV